MLGLAIASLVAAAGLLVAVAFGILVIMLRLSRQCDSSPARRVFTAGVTVDVDHDVNMPQTTRTCHAVNVTVNPVDQLLLLHRQN